MRGIDNRSGMGKNSQINVAIILQGLFTAFVAMLVFSILLTLVVMFFDWQESQNTLLVLNYISIALGGLYAGTRCARRIWFHGLLIGVAYLLILTWLHGDLMLVPSFGWVKRLAGVGLCGMFGAIIGSLFSNQ